MVIAPAVLIVLGLINVDVDNGAFLAEFLHLAGHAIIKAHSELTEDQLPNFIVGHRTISRHLLLPFSTDGPISIGCTVHAQPPKGKIVSGKHRIP